MSKFWKFKNDAGADPELLLYGQISDATWWGDEVTPQQFKQDMEDLGNPSGITVRINSVGGDVFAAHAMFNLLKSHPAKITVMVDGLAASAATIVAMAGDTVQMPSNAMMMVHNPALMLFGSYSADDMDKMSETLGSVKDSIVSAYMSKTGRSAKELSKIMDNETWMTAQQAKDEGFCDVVLYGQDVNTQISNNSRYMIVNSIAHDMSRFDQSRLKDAMTVAESVDTEIKEDDLMEITTIDELRTAYPDLVNQVVEQAVNTAVTTAVAAERTRMQEIDGISHNLDKTLVTNAKYGEQPTTAKDLAYQALQAENALSREYVDARAAELAAAKTKEVDGHTDQQSEDHAAVDKIAAAVNKKLHGTGGKK